MERRKSSLCQKTRFITTVKLYNEILNNAGEILIFDLRPRSDFDLIHYNHYSVNIPYNDDKVNSGFLSALNVNTVSDFATSELVKRVVLRMRRFYIVIVCSNKKVELANNFLTSNLNNNTNDSTDSAFSVALTFYNLLTSNKIREIGFFIDDYYDFLNKYTKIIEKREATIKRIFTDPYPSSILDFKLYVGDESHAKSLEVIKLLNITHIINVTRHSPNFFTNEGVEYLNIEIEDHDEFSAKKYFEEAISFIDKAFYGVISNEVKEKDILNISLSDISDFPEEIWDINELIQLKFKETNPSEKNNVLIHCSLGVSRSPCFAIVYLISKFKLSYSLAIELIKHLRLKSAPIMKFSSELEEYSLLINKK